jgi:hypothetical protein
VNDFTGVEQLVAATTRIHILITVPGLDRAPLVDCDGLLSHVDPHTGTVTAAIGTGRYLRVDVTDMAPAAVPRVLPPNVTRLPRRHATHGGDVA